MVRRTRSAHHGLVTDEHRTEQGSDRTVETTTPAAQPGTRRLTRRTEGKMLGGVATGLADYFGVDPVIFRIGFVIAAFVGGAGILAYLLAWVVIPEAGTGTSEAERALRVVDKDRTRTWLGIGLLVVGSLMLVDQVAWWNPALFWGFALIAIGVILFRTDASSAAPEETMAPRTETRPAATSVDRTKDAQPIAAPRDRSVLGWLSVGTALIAVGIASVLVESDVISLEAGQFFGIALAILGAGLILGAWWGRSRLLIVLGLLLFPLTVASTAAQAPFEGGVGERFYTPQSGDQVRTEYRLGAGEMSIDFTEMDFTGQAIDTEASVVAGRLEVIVPSDVTVDVSGHVGVGEIRLFDRVQDGAELDANAVAEGSATGGSLDLELETSFGELVVTQAPFSN
jgi:phage shock protein PspC (stress-responsive transcriptional regulator)